MRISLVTLMLAFVMLSGAPAADASHSFEPTDHPYHEAWSAPADFEGDVSIRFTVDFGPARNGCTFYIGMASAATGDILMYADAGGFGAVASRARTVQIHHQDTLDTRERFSGFDGRIGFRFTGAGGFQGTQEVIIAVFSATTLRPDSDDPWLPIEYAIGCDAPFTTTAKKGGTETLGFTHQSFGGTGASVNGITAASVNHDGTIEATFAGPHVQLHWMEHANSAGTLMVQGPEGDATRWDLAKEHTGSHEGAAGTYSLHLDRVAVVTDRMWGVLVGVHDVASFDEIV